MNQRAKMSMATSENVKKQQAPGFEQATSVAEPTPAPSSAPPQSRPRPAARASKPKTSKPRTSRSKAAEPKQAATPQALEPQQASTPWAREPQQTPKPQTSKAQTSKAREKPVTTPPAPSPKMQGLAIDKFFYFVMGLRKGEIRKRVDRMKAHHPDDSPEQLARRFISAQAPLSLFGAALMHAPILVPVLGPALKVLGMAGGTAVMMRINMSLILEIALLFGHDIDEHARVKEMAAVIALTGLSSGTSMIPEILAMKPYYKFAIGGFTVATVSQLLIGEAAIRYYGGSRVKVESPAS